MNYLLFWCDENITEQDNNRILHKWHPFWRRHFQMHFLEWIAYLIFIQVFFQSLFLIVQLTLSLGSSHDLMPSGRQAIISTNDDPYYWRENMSPGLNLWVKWTTWIGLEKQIMFWSYIKEFVSNITLFFHSIDFPVQNTHNNTHNMKQD